MVSPKAGKSGSPKSNKRIKIGIKSQDGNTMEMFSVKHHVPLKKLLMQYCETKQLDYKSTRFVYNGRRVLVNATPEELHMKDDDQIDAMVHVHSG